MYSSGMVVTLTPWHHGPAASLRTWLKAYVELTLPWPERGDMDVPMAVCMAVVMGELKPMPSDEQIALWREHLTSSMTDAVLGVSRGDHLWSVLWQLRATTTSYEEANRRRARVLSRRVHAEASLAMAMPPTAARATKHSDDIVRECQGFT